MKTMNKKILVGLTSAALLASIAAPALATGCFGPWCFPQTSSDITVNLSNDANVSNDVVVVASTGDNEIGGGRTRSREGSSGGSGLIMTGDAWAEAIVTNQVNSNDTKIEAPCADCNGDVALNIDSDANLSNRVKVIADTGDNELSCGCGSSGGCHRGGDRGGSRGGVIMTGDAGSYADILNIVNSNITRIIR